MRIKEISISRLFGLFDHTIPMRLADHVTIITGPNGYGKTTILRLVDSFVAGHYSELRRIPFRDARIVFEDGTILQIIRVDAPRSPNRSSNPDLTFALLKGQKREQSTLSAPPREAMAIPLSMIERVAPGLSRIGPSLWRDKKSGREMDVEEVIRSYGHFLPIADMKTGAYTEAPWLVELRKKMKVKFIEVQRLLRVSKSGDKDEEPWRPSVVVYSTELATQIKDKLAEYATLSQSLDRSFPKRLVEETGSSDKKKISSDGLRNRLQQLEDKRVKLTDAGLLDKGDDRFDLASMMKNPTLVESVLPVYAQDGEQKLQVFDDIAAKIELLTSIVNAHFQYKILSIDKEKGFQFYTNYPGDNQNKPRPLSIARLSSGEQHMLVLLFELLFTVAPGSLVMIDEPEISLHVTWQLEFLRDIQRVTELTGIDALIATHAPAIINDRSDLTVALEDPVR